MSDAWGLYDDDEIAATEKAAALAQLLRQQRGDANLGNALGTLGLLTGDRVLAGVGKAHLGGAQDMRADAARQEALLAQAGQFRLQKALAAQEAQKDREVRRDELRQRGLDRALQRQMYGLNREQAAEDKRAAASEKSTKEFVEDAEKLNAPGFYSKADQVRTILDAHKEDLPGFGAFAGRLPGWQALIGKEGIQLRQAAGQMLAEYQKSITGAGASDVERANLQKITGLVESGDEAALREGVRLMTESMDQRMATRAAGTPGAAQTVAGRLPWLKNALGRSTGATKPTVVEERVADDGRTIQLLSDGTKRVKP